MKQEKTVDALNSLITINNDRVEGYETASKESEEQDLKSLFAGFINTSNKCNRELTGEVSRLGGKVSKGTKTTGKFFRAWMELKAALTGKDRKAILNSCDYGENKAVSGYNKTLKNSSENLSAEQQSMLRTQHASIKADHDKVKSLRDTLVIA